MALKVNAGDVRRGDLFFVDPFQVIVQEELRGRRFPPTSEQIVEMAMSIFDNGQRQAIECRRVEDSRLQSTAGFTRINAIRLIREGFTGTDGVHRQDAEFKVQVKIVDCNDETALRNNIVENAHRNETSDIDDAHNQNTLRERYGYDDTKIATLYQYKSAVKVGRLRKLLQLSVDEQLLVHTGVLGTQAALDALELPVEKRTEIFSTLSVDGKINGSVVADQVREHILSDNNKSVENADSPEVETGKKYKARTVRNIRQFFETLKESDNPAMSRFANDALRWVSGKTTDKAMTNALNRLNAAEVEELKEAA
jgi:hypothetical protein